MKYVCRVKMSSFQATFSWVNNVDGFSEDTTGRYVYIRYRYRGMGLAISKGCREEDWVVSRRRSAFGHQITLAAPITGLCTDINSALNPAPAISLLYILVNTQCPA